MRGILYAAVLAAIASADAGAANWTTFIGSNPNFPNQLAERGLAVDAGGYVAVQAYNRLAWSGQVEFTHEYTLDANGTIPWIWGLVGKVWSYALIPHGVDQRDGYRVVWLERADDPWSSRDELSLVPPGSSQPNGWLAEPRTGGKVVKAISGGSDGAFALRALDAGAGFEIVAFDGPYAKWRTALQPCSVGAAAANLDIDYVPGNAWPAPYTISVAGSCDNGVDPPQVFVQRFDANSGTATASEWIYTSPDRQLVRYAFSAGHELVAVYTTPWGDNELHRIGAPGAPYTPPPMPLFGIEQVTALVPSGGAELFVVGTLPGGSPAAAPVLPGIPAFGPVPLSGVAGFPGGDWTIAAARDGKLLASRTETSGTSTLVRLVGMDASGALEWTSTIADTLSGSVPQVVPARDYAGGFIVAVDKQDAGGTVGIHVQRVGSSP